MNCSHDYIRLLFSQKKFLTVCSAIVMQIKLNYFEKVLTSLKFDVYLIQCTLFLSVLCLQDWIVFKIISNALRELPFVSKTKTFFIVWYFMLEKKKCWICNSLKVKNSALFQLLFCCYLYNFNYYIPWKGGQINKTPKYIYF